MDYPKLTHEIWISVEDPSGELYGDALIGIAYTDTDGSLHPKFSAWPCPQAKVTLRPIEPVNG